MDEIVQERWHCNCADYGFDGHYICSLCGENWGDCNCALTEPFVALTDSSWAGSGGHNGSRRYHWPAVEDDARPACGTFAVLGNGSATADPAVIAEDLQCRRNGCRQRWTQFASR